MLKKLLLISCLLVLSNCSAPGTALLGPAFTGAKTGSVYQASLSYGTAKVMNKISDLNVDSLFDIKISESFDIAKMPNILNTYIVNEIEVSEVIEPEPLP